MTWANWKARTTGRCSGFRRGTAAAKDMREHIGTAFWRRQNDGMLYVWDRRDVLRAYNFVNNRFVTTPAARECDSARDDWWSQRFGQRL